jgi:hypothetical protein
MGWDSIEPFVANDFSNKAAFILCKTSNLSSKVCCHWITSTSVSPTLKDFQNLTLTTGELVYEKVFVQ